MSLALYIIIYFFFFFFFFNLSRWEAIFSNPFFLNSILSSASLPFFLSLQPLLVFRTSMWSMASRRGAVLVCHLLFSVVLLSSILVTLPHCPLPSYLLLLSVTSRILYNSNPVPSCLPTIIHIYLIFPALIVLISLNCCPAVVSWIKTVSSIANYCYYFMSSNY